MEDYKTVEEFFDYLIIDDDGWKGIKADAPESAKKAYENYRKQAFIARAVEFGYKDDQIRDLLDTIEKARADGVDMHYEEIELIPQPIY